MKDDHAQDGDPASPAARDLPPKVAWLLLAVTVGGAAVLRFYHLSEQGYRFCDEGYHLNLPILYLVDHQEPFLFFKHGLLWFIAVGISVLGLSQAASMQFSGICGLATVVLFYALLSQLFNRRVAVLGAAAMACSHYVLFYNRSNMSDGYALMFFCLIALLLVQQAKAFGLWLEAPADRQRRTSRRRWLWLLLAGLLLGFSFTVRIQTCLTLLGMAGAWGLTLLLMRRRQAVKPVMLAAAVLLLLAALGYALTMGYLRHNVEWNGTLEWYGKNVTVAGAQGYEWQAYLVSHLTRYCGWPLLLLGFVGLVCLHRRPGFGGLWLLLCWWGLLLAFLKMGLPFPRAHLYLVFFLCIFWAIAIDWIGRRLAGVSRRVSIGIAAAVVLTALTAAVEISKSRHLLTAEGGYDKVGDYLLGTDIGKEVIATHAWPIFRALHLHRTVVLYDFVDGLPSEESKQHDWMIDRLRESSSANITHMVLDSYVPYASSASETLFLQRFCATYPPDLVVRNEFGMDSQTSWDAFHGMLLPSMFTHYHIVYRVGRFRADTFEAGQLSSLTDAAALEARLLEIYGKAPE